MVDVAGTAHISGWLRVAAVGLVRLGDHREAVNALVVNYRHQDCVVGRVRAAVIG
ncbi:hypothetical protein D9M68_337530 [compost metagenome]